MNKCVVASAMSVFEGEDKPGWNRWWVRRALKTGSGILFALAIWGPVLLLAGFPASWYPPNSFLFGMLGLIMLYGYYVLDRDFKKKLEERGAQYQPIGE
ncbi:hypothetical protein EU537_08085 [Candidatus Thorarchaeota archaeon]|nr:MAG: hypothetical protein EU537_08085 [Candidatus Thorarchaeota archaeon]